MMKLDGRDDLVHTREYKEKKQMYLIILFAQLKQQKQY